MTIRKITVTSGEVSDDANISTGAFDLPAGTTAQRPASPTDGNIIIGDGSNFTTATLTALPNFSTDVKCAKVNDLSVTAGTQLKYKISFANQAQGSKEARIRGVSLNY